MRIRIPFQLDFRRVDKGSLPLIYKWLEQPHIQEWLHGEGLQNVYKDLAKFVNGEPSLHEHWLAYDKDKNIPFAYLLTSEIIKDSNDEDDLVHWCQTEGRAITLDLFICDSRYMGKGFSYVMIQEFLVTKFSNVSEVLISPEATNARAVHVYKKAGFHIIGEFIASWHPVLHYMMHVNMKELIEKQV